MKAVETVFVGLSGGVDSSVAALRLKQSGKRVVGVFIKVWQPDFITCDWEKERLDAMRVAAHLDIPFTTFNAEDAYKREVADYMIREYTEGRTPNPDVMCNEHVKFGAFFDFARASGADKVATGHYARVERSGDYHHLMRGKDPQKDQSYFLWRLTERELKHTYFPIGDTEKGDVRREAERAGIPTSAKRDSQGICFLGQVNMEEFLSHYVDRAEGFVLDTRGNTIGTHHGALLYTYGQRHGFSVTTNTEEGRPYYVVGKDMTMNTITVDHTPRMLSTEQVTLSHLNDIGGEKKSICEAQFRYRQKPFRVSLEREKDDRAILSVLDTHIEEPSAGQSCVLYDGERCLGGGIIV